MADTIALIVYVPLLTAAMVAVWRRPLLELYIFIVGLAVHNLAMSLLYGIGVRGVGLDVIQAWKETLLAVAIARLAHDALRDRRLTFHFGTIDALAVAFALLACVYALVGDASVHAVGLGLRHVWVPVAAYLLGRAVVVTRADLRSLVWTLLGAAAFVAIFGLVDNFLVPVEWWRDSGAVGYYRDELGFDYHGPGGLPDNWAFNAGAEEGVYRRLVSTFVSPLGTAFMLVVALLFALAAPVRWPRALLASFCFVALLFTLSRSSLLVLAGALLVLALARRRWWPAAAAVGVVAVSFLFVSLYQSLAPETHFFRADLPFQEQRAREQGDVAGGLADPAEPSIASHLTALREGLDNVAHHPQGHGLGTAGATAVRSGETPVAGESNYTEIGAELGVLGLALFLAWNLGLLWRLLRRARWAAEPEWRWTAAAVAASLAAVLALAVQTDVYGVPWLAYCLWWLAGAARA
jgi:hypothetical protein